MVINNEITLDISKQTQFIKMSLPQGDNIDRVFKINLVNGVDEYIIPTTATVRFEMTRPNGDFIYNNCPVESNQVNLEITPSISAVDGRFPAQFRITDSSTGGLIKSFRFHILIHESVDIEKVVINTSEFTALQDMELRVGDITPAIQAAETATDNANSAATNANNKANQLENETLIIWKPYVSTYANIATTYPTPELGWTTQAQDTGIRWRYNGVAWINIGVSTDDKVGDLSTVTTTNKTNVVSAINEVSSQLADNATLLSSYSALAIDGDWSNALKTALLVAEGTELIINNKGFNYVISETISIPSNIKIIGKGMPTLFLKENSNCTMFDVTDKQNITIEGIISDGNRLNQSIRFDEEPEVTAAQKGFIKFINSNNISVKNNIIKSFLGDGVTISGIAFQADITNVNKNIEVFNNDIYDNGRNGISVIHGDGVSIKQNKLHGQLAFVSSLGSGVDIEINPSSGQWVTRNITVDDNDVYNNNSGIQVVGMESATNNSIVEQIFIKGNRVYKNIYNGIYAVLLTNKLSPMGTFKNIYILNNLVIETFSQNGVNNAYGIGIRIETCDIPIIVKNNKISYSSKCIGLSSVDNAVVENNVIDNFGTISGGCGIRLISSARDGYLNLTTNNNIIKNNVIQNAIQPSYENIGIAIYIRASTEIVSNNQISNNYISDDGTPSKVGSGIRIVSNDISWSTGAINNIIKDNDLKNCNSAFIQLVNVSNNIILNNTINGINKVYLAETNVFITKLDTLLVYPIEPTSGLYDGYTFYNSSLAKPLFYYGGVWRDATGTTVTP